VHIVWIRHTLDSSADYSNYPRLHWRPVNGILFAELESYDIRGQSAMITRSIQHGLMPYIPGATGEERRLLRDYPNTPLSWINYLFIDVNEAVRAWLLSNPVLEELLDLLIYCYRPNNISREPTLVLRGHNYLVPGAMTNWANEEIAEAQLREGLIDPEA